MSNYIIHYGIKGQKHGIRRFQNEDGSLTPAGKERYAKMIDKSADATGALYDEVEETQENYENREKDIEKAEKKKKASKNKSVGKKTVAEARVQAARGKQILGTSKDLMKISMKASAALYRGTTTRSFTKKIVRKKTLIRLTEKYSDMESVVCLISNA